jgi:hypothetical protein
MSRPVLTFEPLRPFHVKQIVEQPRQAAAKIELTPANIAELCAGRVAEALVASDGVDAVAVACGGLVDEQAGRAKAWSLIGTDMPWSAWTRLIPRMRQHIETALAEWAHRVWAETVYDWPEGHKLLLHLGMAYEGMSRGTFGPDRHGVTYARVRDDVAALPTRVRAMNTIAERCLWEDSLSQAVPWAVEQARRAARGGA